MAIDFKALSESGGSFVANAENWPAYQHWLATEARCRGCGTMYKDIPRDSRGTPLESWMTETECGECFAKSCAEAREAEKQASAIQCPHCGQKVFLTAAANPR